jgi:hypothetical protein
MESAGTQRGLVKFLTDLAGNPAMIRNLQSNPTDLMDSYGLTPDEKAAIVSRDVEGLKRIVTEKFRTQVPAELAEAALTITFFIQITIHF